MDKNMINIDDLFRDRLSGGEEQERTGAWLHMRDLLDKNIPVAPAPVGFGWKRFAGLLVGAALLAALSVGGYKIATHGHKDMADTDANGNTVGAAGSGHGTAASTSTGEQPGSNNVPNTIAGTAGNENGNTRSTTTSGDNIAAATTGNNNSNLHQNSRHTAADRTSAGISHRSTTMHNIAGAHSQAQPAQDHILKSEQLAGPNAHTANDRTDISGTGDNRDNNNSDHTDGTHIAAPVNNNHNLAAGSANSVRTRNPEQVQHRGNTGTSTDNTAANNTGHTAAVNSMNSNSRSTTGNNAPADRNRTPGNAANSVANNTSNTNNNMGNTTPAPVLKKDTIEKIRLVQHYNRRRGTGTGTQTFRMDTIGVEQMIVNRPQENSPATASGTASVTKTAGTKTAGATSRNLKNAGMPASATPATAMTTPAAANSAAGTADAASNLVPLSNYRVASKKGGWDPQRFEDMVTMFKFKMSQIKLYPGIVAGINATMFGPNSFGGFQLGMASTIAISDRLSLAAELKYISRFNSGVTVVDNYAGGPKDSVAIYNPQGTALEFMNYTRDSTHHYFNFSMLNSIEMPVSVKYSIGRFFMMGGLNFAYHIRVNAEEVKRELVAQTIVPYNHPPITWPENKPAISTKDFNSRFEVGGLLGFGYEMTPSVQLDLRVTKSFWDNARSNGAKTVSDQLYRAPSVQLSIGYRFSQQSH